MQKTPILKPTLNQADIDLLMRSMSLVFPTKVEMDQRFKQAEKTMNQRFQQNAQNMLMVFPTKSDVDEQIEKVATQLQVKYDQVITLLDGVMSELRTIRQEQVVMIHQLQGHTEQISAINSDVVNHEQRIGKLELAVNLSPA